MKQLLHVLLEGAVLSCIAGAFYAGFAIQGGYFEAGIFTEAVLTGEPVNGAGFFRSVGFEGIVGFGDIDVDAGLVKRDDFQFLSDGGLDLFHFMLVVGGENELDFGKGWVHISNKVFRHIHSLLFKSLLSSPGNTSSSREGAQR